MSGPSLPTRVTHVVDPDAAGHDSIVACLAARRAIDDAAARRSGGACTQEAWLLGSTRAERDAWALGFLTADRVGSFRGPSVLARWSGLQRLWTDRVKAGGWREEDEGPAGGALVCWSLGALTQAVKLRPRPERIIGVFTAAPAGGEHVYEAWGVSVAAVSEPIAAAWRHRGVGPAQVVTALDLPSIEVDAARWRAEREIVRAELGLRPEEAVTMLLGDPVRSGDARRFAAILGMTRVAEPSAVGIISARADQIRRAAEYTHKHGRAWDLIAFDGPLLRAMPAADMVFWDIDENRGAWLSDRPMGGLISAATACAAGVPVVAVREPISEGLLAAAGEACLTRDASVPRAVQRLLPMGDDPAFRASVGAKLRSAWETARGASRFAEQVVKLCAAPTAESPYGGGSPLVPLAPIMEPLVNMHAGGTQGDRA